MSLTKRVFIGLVAGFAIGVVASATGSNALLAVASLVRPIGTLWVNAVLMTVIPLVVASLVVSIGSVADSRLVGSVGWRAVLLLLVLLFVGAAFAALLAPILVAWLPIDQSAAASLRTAITTGATANLSAAPTLGQWVAGLAPANAIRAAADGAMLPLVIFTLAFAVALTRVSTEVRPYVIGFFAAIAQAMIVLLGWVIRLAPVGVFALALPLGAQAGAAAAGVLVYYIALSVALCLSATGALYVIASAAGRVPIRLFARAAAPAQAVAAGSRSSLAALPAMVTAAGAELRLPAVVGGVFLPFAVATFKFTSPLTYVAAACFFARAFGVPLEPARLASIIPLAVAMSLGVPGVPGGWFTTAPVFAAAGLPAEVIGILLAVDTVPDMFRTLGNVTADLAAATIVARYVGQGAPERNSVDERAAAPAPGR